jgi:signal peptide peptidase SppA
MRTEFEQMFGAGALFVEPKAFRAWLATAKVKAAGLTSADAVQKTVLAFDQRTVAPQIVGDVAVIDVCGPITYKSSWLSYYFGGAAIVDLQQQFRLAIADPSVKTIAFRFDSPGGCIDMMSEFADEVFAAKGKGKPILAVADTMICSCAYWLASQADTIYATKSAQLGAIGVFCEHDDVSGMLEKAGIKITLIAHGENKVDGSPYEPLSDTARADMQASVDEIGGWFDTAVARGRGVDTDVVLSKFGQGKVFRGQKAISLGLADKPGTFGQVLGKLVKGRVVSARADVAAKPAVLAGKKADEDDVELPDGCDECDPECPCEETECGPECSTCSEECACVKASKAAKAEAQIAAETQARADQDALAIAMVLSTDLA